MIPLLQHHSDAIADLCRRFDVARLEVFGSAATGEFQDATSDIDLIVEFLPGTDLGPWMAKFFHLREQLAALLNRPVDLVMSKAPRNPYFVREVNRTRRMLYAA